MQSKEFTNTLLFRLYEMFPGKWEVKEDIPQNKLMIYFNGKYTKFDITLEWTKCIPDMENEQAIFVRDQTFNAIVERLVENGI